MKKTLPKINKSLKNFILEEDAKIIDKTATKIAITSSFLALSLGANIDDANAQGHGNHSNHTNNVAHEGDIDKTYQEDQTLVHESDNMGNDQDETKTKDLKDGSISYTAEIAPKTVKTVHGNHYNHSDGAGKS